MAEIKIANPGPLGLSGFALTTFVLSWSNSGFMPKAVDTLVVIGLAFFYGGIAQLLAGMWEFRSGNTFGATAFTSYGAFWLSFAALFLPGLGGAAALVSPPAIGIYLVGWTIFTLIMLVASLRTNGATVAVFALLTVTFAVLALAWLSGSKGAPDTTWNHIGGYLGILTALAAWYTAAAGVLAGVSNGKLVLPVFPMAA